MIKHSVPNIIPGEAFDKVGEVLNRVHHVRCIKWDLRVPAVVWAYRTMYKTLTAQVFPKLKYEAGARVPMENAKISPRITTPIDTIVHTDQNEEIAQWRKKKHIRLEEEIRQGNFRLRELEKDQV